jgi:SAM-dependent methyltransferase
MKMSERDSRRAGILMNGLGTLIECQRANDAGGDCEETKKGAYPFIPMSIGAAMQTFEHLEKHLKKEKRWCGHNTNDAKFLDAGCGIGNVLLLASIYQLANRYHGIEYFEDTANRARTWLGINNPRRKNLPSKFSIIQDDILTFKDYGAYDIIYFYCPMLEPRLQIRFEERLEDEMQVGAILIPRMKRGVMIREDYRFELLSFDGVAEKIFLKVKDGPRKKSEMDLIDRYTRHDPEREAAMQKLIKAGTLRG